MCSIHYLHFAFGMHIPSQALKDFTVDFSIYLELLIIGVVF